VEAQYKENKTNVNEPLSQQNLAQADRFILLTTDRVAISINIGVIF
jgi:hypothetical protein